MCSLSVSVLLVGMSEYNLMFISRHLLFWLPQSPQITCVFLMSSLTIPCQCLCSIPQFAGCNVWMDCEISASIDWPYCILSWLLTVMRRGYWFCAFLMYLVTYKKSSSILWICSRYQLPTVPRSFYYRHWNFWIVEGTAKRSDGTVLNILLLFVVSLGFV